MSVLTEPIRVVLAEDSYLVREGIRRLLESDPAIHLVAACADLEELLTTVSLDNPDVVVTDIRMPPHSTDEGIRAAATFHDTAPGVGVVVLSQHDEPEYALALFERGSNRRAYLLKDSLSDPRLLLDAIRAVAAGGSVVDPRVVERLVAVRSGHVDSRIRQLTDRELEVLTRMAEGCNNDTIAARLHLSLRMVEKHINLIFSKLGLTEEVDVHRRVKAVLIYLSEHGD